MVPKHSEGAGDLLTEEMRIRSDETRKREEEKGGRPWELVAYAKTGGGGRGGVSNSAKAKTHNCKRRNAGEIIQSHGKTPKLGVMGGPEHLYRTFV